MRVHCEHLPFSREPNSIRAWISTHSIGYNKMCFDRRVQCTLYTNLENRDDVHRHLMPGGSPLDPALLRARKRR